MILSGTELIVNQWFEKNLENSAKKWFLHNKGSRDLSFVKSEWFATLCVITCAFVDRMFKVKYVERIETI